METNANSSLLGMILKDSRKGTFTGLITKKKGVVRGKGAAKAVYGDDTVQTVIITGFNYERLVKRSLALLPTILDKDIVKEALDKGLLAKNGESITLADVADARYEIEESFQRTLNSKEESESTTSHVYEPLTINGEKIIGGRVYRCVADTGRKCHCRECTGDKRAPLDGTIYIQGLLVWSKVLVPAPNGPVPAPKSSAKTIAKNLIKSHLPVDRYRHYPLEPGTDFILRAGGTAEIEAQQGGFKVTDDIIEVIQRAVV